MMFSFDSRYCNYLQKAGINIHRNVLFNRKFYLNGPVTIGSGGNVIVALFDAYASVGNDCKLICTVLGRYCTIGNNVSIGLNRHSMDDLSTSPEFSFSAMKSKIDRIGSVAKKYGRVNCISFLGSDVHIGNNVLVGNDANIATGAMILPNSIITKNVPPFAIVSGCNKIEGYRYSDEVISDLMALKWWDLDLPKMLKHGIQIPSHNIKEFIQFIKELPNKDQFKILPQWVSFDKRTTANIEFKQEPSQEVMRFIQALAKSQIAKY